MKHFRYTYFRSLRAAGDERAVPYEVFVATARNSGWEFGDVVQAARWLVGRS